MDPTLGIVRLYADTHTGYRCLHHSTMGLLTPAARTCYHWQLQALADSGSEVLQVLVQAAGHHTGPRPLVSHNAKHSLQLFKACRRTCEQPQCLMVSLAPCLKPSTCGRLPGGCREATSSRHSCVVTHNDMCHVAQLRAAATLQYHKCLVGVSKGCSTVTPFLHPSSNNPGPDLDLSVHTAPRVCALGTMCDGPGSV